MLKRAALPESDAYSEFLTRKVRRIEATGLRRLPTLCSSLKPFQRDVVGWALKLGRAALFEGTGLGKTIQQLSWASAVSAFEQAPILVLTPLAVAEQTVAEAARFGIAKVAYAASGSVASGNIVVTNYERFDRFNMADFAGIVLDESGIIKSQDGKLRAELTDACRKLRWRLACTATPAPNDYTELGQHAEFLGAMTAKEMLATFFVHDGSIRADGNPTSSSDGWRLKRHAEKDFWAWVSSWAAVIRNPRDLGYSEPGYDLPKLEFFETLVRAEHVAPEPGTFFPSRATTLGERIRVRRQTAGERVRAAAKIVLREPDEPWLIWCNLNSEADEIEALLSAAGLSVAQVAGRHDAATKVERLLGFKQGAPLDLISKPSIAGHGMNWQHCARMVIVGLTDSFEQIYQAARRCWRFGQTRPVHVHFVVSELEGAVAANIRRKEAAYDYMLNAMSGHTKDLVRAQLQEATRGTVASYQPTTIMEIPPWL